ncbi:DUF4365 domain-containing protein [Streptomyces sp. Li-HN-5-11]|uniref:DUF4365 domain-containing protein n=1 Tax=Streptomyces sp. Li-HN-5-11 TaxID=3075432 RepID=UPI0037DA65CE
MRVKPTQQVDRAGVSWIEHLVVTELGWMFRQQETADFGIDTQLEIVDSETSKATGRLIGVQGQNRALWHGHALPRPIRGPGRHGEVQELPRPAEAAG